MRRLSASIALVLALFVASGSEALAKKKSRTPVTSSVQGLEISPQELRIRVRALIRPTLGIIEEGADKILLEATDPAIRRGTIVWKIEMTTTLLTALLRSDAVLALADAWGYVIQVEQLLEHPEAKAKYGAAGERGSAALAEIEKEFRAFVTSLQSGLNTEGFESRVRQWAERHPIEGALYRRPSLDSALAKMLASSSGGGAFAALGSLEETTADAMARMDLYTVYLPRLARWEAELAADDLTRGLDAPALASEFVRLTKAADRLAGVAEGTPDLVTRERAATLAALRAERVALTESAQGERRAVVDAIREEREATLKEVEAIAERLLNRSGSALHEVQRTESEALVQSVEAMRVRLIQDAARALNGVVDHGFFRLVELLLIGAALAALGLVLYARFLRS